MTEGCRHEPQVRRAAAEDRWTDALREHVTTCADCAAAADASQFMSRLSRLDERPRALPDPSVVWLKAQLLRGSAIAERAARPLNILQMIAYTAVAVGWTSVLTWKWNDLHRWLAGFTPASIATGGGLASPLSIPFLFMIVVLATMTVMLALHTILAED
jgi:hypothetical protein